ncbi:DoxX family protein [Cerasicoccus arenae]|uniref:Quinol oxidase n=1 Tax=Cerasicoccus arenae TaxID=424488 RepID=A0A8J3GEP7_9BACT|nr:DoxX family protein [Cerasicoccus arenae]MBK1859410.1 DoxX family protein [Cerasicoccus arenae]GHC10833.1 quinol oxidase [Cerasicoccus arenae]
MSKFAKYVNHPDVGLLIIRVVAGLIFVAAGIPKFAGGADMLKQVGAAMSTFGITFAPLLWGILAATAELLGGILLIIGLGTRTAAFFLLSTMIVAAAVLLNGGGEIVKDAGFPITLGAISLALIFTGPGKYAVKR